MPNSYISIVDCDICRNIPQKISRDLENGEYPGIPPEFSRLSTVVEIEEETNEAYCTSFTKLLKCPQCGTYYYHNIYEDEGQHFMDPTCHQTTIRRYDPITAMHFLEGFVAKAPESALPPHVRCTQEGLCGRHHHAANGSSEWRPRPKTRPNKDRI